MARAIEMRDQAQARLNRINSDRAAADAAWQNAGVAAQEQEEMELASRLSMEQPPSTRRGLPLWVLQKLPVTILDEGTLQARGVKDEEATCAICVDPLELSQRCIKLRCSHLFHERCALRWLEIGTCCPICRAKVVNSAEEGSNGSGQQHAASQAVRVMGYIDSRGQVAYTTSGIAGQNAERRGSDERSRSPDEGYPRSVATASQAVDQPPRTNSSPPYSSRERVTESMSAESVYDRHRYDRVPEETEGGSGSTEEKEGEDSSRDSSRATRLQRLRREAGVARGGGAAR
jgi:hypothetical protein